MSHPAFSLFTALIPTRLDPREFYAQVAFRPAIFGQLFRTLGRSPWLIPRLTKIPAALRALKDPRTFLEAHRQVQGDRLRASPAASGS